MRFTSFQSLMKAGGRLWHGLYEYEFEKLGIPKPDLSIYLCVTPDIALKHILSCSAEGDRKMDITKIKTSS